MVMALALFKHSCLRSPGEQLCHWLCGNRKMASLQILFSLISLMSSLSALISPEERWVICSCSACSEAVSCSQLTEMKEWDPSPSFLGSGTHLFAWEPICLSNPTLLFAKVIFCSFVKWNRWTMGSDLCHSCLKVKHWQCMGFHWHGMELREKQKRARWWIADLVWKLL